MAEKISELVAKELSSVKIKKGSTKEYQLSGGEFSSDTEIRDFAQRISNDAQYAYLSDAIRERWVYRYGRNVEQILKYADESRGKYTDIDQLALAAEISYCYDHEMVTNEMDFAIRRTGMIYFDKIRLDKNLQFIHRYLRYASSYRRAKQQSPQRIYGSGGRSDGLQIAIIQTRSAPDSSPQHCL